MASGERIRRLKYLVPLRIDGLLVYSCLLLEPGGDAIGEMKYQQSRRGNTDLDVRPPRIRRS